MTLERAVEVLNANRHRGYATWRAAYGFAATDPPWAILWAFEAIAVAEKYVREAIFQKAAERAATMDPRFD